MTLTLRIWTPLQKRMKETFKQYQGKAWFSTKSKIEDIEDFCMWQSEWKQKKAVVRLKMYYL